MTLGESSKATVDTDKPLKRMRVLTISNGHGEDLLAALLLKTMAEQSDHVGVVAYPVVGEGGAYARAQIDVVGVQQTMPTGGFIMKGPTNIFKDVRAGLLGLTWRQINDLKKRREDYDAVLAVGDMYALWLAGRFVRLPTIFVPTAKSEFIEGHFAADYALMRKYARRIFPRDRRTDEAMRARGLPSKYVGNLMMDAMEVTGDRFGLDERGPVITFLPGSRQDAFLNAGDLFEVGRHVLDTIKSQEENGNDGGNVRFVLSVAPGLDIGAFKKLAAESGLNVTCIQGRFGDVLNVADIVIGLAGTGNEQAAGLGKPVVTFVGRGTQFTRKFAHDQKKLLGEAVALTDGGPQAVARETVDILNNEMRYKTMAAAGRERMGEPGAAREMAGDVVRFLTGLQYIP